MAARALTYGPDGEVTTDDLTGGKAVELSAKPRPTHAYTSREPDPGTGFYHYGPRTYDPSLRRWLSPDPLIGMAPERQALWGEQLNLYSYASNNPARWTDLSGLEGPTVMEKLASLGHFAGAAVVGFVHGLSPVPVPDPPIANEKGTAYEKEHVVGFGFGQVVGGAFLVGKGVDTMGKGGEVAVGSGGAATLGGAVVVAAGATMVYSGARSAAAGLVTLYNEARNHGRGGGSTPKSDASSGSGAGSPRPGSGQTDGAARQAVGTAREARVAEATGGKVSNERIEAPSLGSTDIDVIGGNGDLVMVGGPAKARDVGNLGRVILLYQREAAIKGVGVRAYFASDTPQSVLEFSAKRIGAANVFKIPE